MWLFWALLLYICVTGAVLVKIENKYRACLNYTSKYKYLFITISMGVLMLLAMFRSQYVGNDTKRYMELFTILGKWKSKTNIEFGFNFFTRSVAYFTNNAYFLIMLSSLFIYMCFIRFLQKNTKTCTGAFIAVIVFFSTMFRFSLSGIRQCMAMAIIAAFSYDFLVKRKPIKFIISIFFAFAFHYTSAIFLIIYPLTAIKNRKKNLILSAVMLGATSVCVLFFNQIISLFVAIVPKYAYFVSDKYMSNGIRPASLLNLAVITFLLFVRIVFTKKEGSLEHSASTKRTLVYSIDIPDKIMLIGLCVSILALRLNALDRLASYFTIFEVIYVPFIAANAKKERGILVGSALAVIFTVKSALELYLRPDWNVIFPYSFFFMD